MGNAHGIPPTIRPQPLDGSRVAGTATAGASGHGTAVVLDLRALAPWGRVRVPLHADTSAHAGASFAEFVTASFAEIVTAKPNPKGAACNGRIRFHGGPVDFSTLQDGAHVLSVVSGSSVVACGVIPGIS